jgi:FixJ family two-component response regulator
MAMGAEEFLTKPLDVRRFLDVVNRTLAGRIAA